jgi:hypothetical protein
MRWRKIERLLPAVEPFLSGGPIFVRPHRPVTQTPTQAMADLAAIFLMGALLSKDCASLMPDFFKPLQSNTLKTKQPAHRSLALFGHRPFRANLAARELTASASSGQLKTIAGAARLPINLNTAGESDDKMPFRQPDAGCFTHASAAPGSQRGEIEALWCLLIHHFLHGQDRIAADLSSG